MMRMINVNGVRRKLRGSGRLIPPKPKLAYADRRRSELREAIEAARNSVPKLESLISSWAVKLRAATEAGTRHAYVAVLAKVYDRVEQWKDKEIIEERITQVALLRSKRRRKNSTVYGEVIGAVCDRAGRSSKTANRWATKLNEASTKKVSPKNVADFLRGSAERPPH